jgi:hypothetical protein
LFDKKEKNAIMKIKYFVFIIFALLLFSCSSMKNNAIKAAEIMLNDIIYNRENIKDYFYNPVDDIYYIFLNVYDENGKWIQYSGGNLLEKYNEIKNNYGEIINYEIIKIEYDYDIFPFYDYGYPHGIRIEMKVHYNGFSTYENINGYYIKEIDKTNIASYSIEKAIE